MNLTWETINIEELDTGRGFIVGDVITKRAKFEGGQLVRIEHYIYDIDKKLTNFTSNTHFLPGC